ncbi:hypothetical protein V5F49_06830 [Xanthobacter sp. V3C-3]|uniref:hypothetical protein n=1 Tax=Xanthobacter lutulentifluminis TaxID=3119935 RepID=UPI00372C9452
MSGPRYEDAPASDGWPAAAAPHGYDRTEFRPGESRRDYPSRRPRQPDEERRLLREAEAAFEGPDRRSDMDHHPHDAGADDALPPDPPSRLYRD